MTAWTPKQANAYQDALLEMGASAEINRIISWLFKGEVLDGCTILVDWKTREAIGLALMDQRDGRVAASLITDFLRWGAREDASCGHIGPEGFGCGYVRNHAGPHTWGAG